MFKHSIARLLPIVISVAAFNLRAGAHHGPEETIAMLTQRIESDGETPVLLHRRAAEWRILGQYDKAARDLERAITLNPQFVGAIELLAEVTLRQGEIEKAIARAKRGIEASASGRERAACQMILSRALQQEGRLSEALEACDAAFESFPRGDIDWYLIRGALQRNLGLHEERVAGFRRGHELTRSVVLRNLTIEATIDAGRAGEVMAVIDEQVAACRLKSSWLLRRGRAHHSLGNAVAARADLESAVTELEQRLHPIRPEVTLIADRGLARALLGDVAGGREDLDRARELGATESMLDLLLEALEALEHEERP